MLAQVIWNPTWFPKLSPFEPKDCACTEDRLDRHLFQTISFLSLIHSRSKMPQAWQQFRDRVWEPHIKSSIFASSENSPYNIYANPFAAAFKPIDPIQRPVKPPRHPRQNSAAGSVIQGLRDQIECNVCTETKHSSYFPAGKITEKCRHTVDVCTECLTEWIDVQSHDKIWNEIDCPSCGSRLAPEDINKYGSRDVKNRYPACPRCKRRNLLTLHRYNEYCLKALLASGEHYQLCRHPGCEYGAQISHGDTTSWLLCSVCEGRTCISCDTVWHSGLSCEEDRRRRKRLEKDDRASEQRITKQAKMCPKCKVPGEKDSGCDHMRCPKCNHEYCWICLVDYDLIRRKCNNQHLKTCKYHTSRLRS